MRREVWFVACAVLGGGGIAAAAVLSGACIVAPPPDLPIASHAPVILHPSLDPPEGLLMNWPGADNGYTVAIPVEFFDPNPTYAVHVFVDYPGQPGLVYQGPGTRRSVAPSQGGASLIEVPVDPTNPPIDLSACHTIEVFVAHGFDPSGNPHAFDAVGGDRVVWTYAPAGLDGCSVVPFEASVPDDASSDVLAIPPESAAPSSGGSP